VQCSDARRFARAFPNQKVKELQWDQFMKCSRIFTFSIFEQSYILNSSPQERLDHLKEILSIPDDQPFVASQSIQGIVNHDMSAVLSDKGKKGKEASLTSRKKINRDNFISKKRMHANIVDEKEEEEEATSTSSVLMAGKSLRRSTGHIRDHFCEGKQALSMRIFRSSATMRSLSSMVS
jgi:hypothetical protein